MSRHYLTAKELAEALRKHQSYVYAMRRRGFNMRGNIATLDEALNFLESCPHPRSRHQRGRKR